MTPGQVKSELGVNAKATVARYNGTSVVVSAADANIEIILKIEAYRNRWGRLEDVRAYYGNEEVELAETDKEQAESLLVDAEVSDEPDLCERMGIGLTVGVGTR